jgi:hypothetical protein
MLTSSTPLESATNTRTNSEHCPTYNSLEQSDTSGTEGGHLQLTKTEKQHWLQVLQTSKTFLLNLDEDVDKNPWRYKNDKDVMTLARRLVAESSRRVKERGVSVLYLLTIRIIIQSLNDLSDLFNDGTPDWITECGMAYHSLSQFSVN